MLLLVIVYSWSVNINQLIHKNDTTTKYNTCLLLWSHISIIHSPNKIEWNKFQIGEEEESWSRRGDMISGEDD